jgi:hypothetical protein
LNSFHSNLIRHLLQNPRNPLSPKNRSYRALIIANKNVHRSGELIKKENATTPLGRATSSGHYRGQPTGEDDISPLKITQSVSSQLQQLAQELQRIQLHIQPDHPRNAPGAPLHKSCFPSAAILDDMQSLNATPQPTQPLQSEHIAEIERGYDKDF